MLSSRDYITRDDRSYCIFNTQGKITVDGGIETEVKCRISDVGKVLRGMKKVFSCRGS